MQLDKLIEELEQCLVKIDLKREVTADGAIETYRFRGVTLLNLMPDILKALHATKQFVKEVEIMERQGTLLTADTAETANRIDMKWREARDSALSNFNKSME